MTVAAADSLSGAAGVESTLGIADAPSLELRDRIITALRYTFSWAKAVDDGIANQVLNAADPEVLQELQNRVSDMQHALRGLLSAIPADGVFPGNDAKASYEQTSSAFAQLYRDLVFNAATLPQPSLLQQLGGIASGFLDAPVAAVTAAAETASNAIARALGGTAGAIWSALWPYLLIAGAVGVIYVFRAPLGRALGKVAA